MLNYLFYKNSPLILPISSFIKRFITHFILPKCGKIIRDIEYLARGKKETSKPMLYRFLPLSFISLNTNISSVFDQIDRNPLILTPSIYTDIVIRTIYEIIVMGLNVSQVRLNIDEQNSNSLYLFSKYFNKRYFQVDSNLVVQSRNS